MNVQAAQSARIPTTAVIGLIIDAMIKADVSDDDAARIAELMGRLSADEQSQLEALCRKLGGVTRSE